MKASEFRVGNLLDKDGSIVIVDAETILKFQCELKECERYQPIPLTEEWLFKFGFTITYLITRNIKAVIDYRESRVLMIKSGFLDENDIENYWVGIDQRHISNVKYVHQLQNLYFALTGQEL